MDWRHKAACRDEDPELFYPVGNSGPALLQIAEAKTVCRRCSVADSCLDWALASGQEWGVWGGTSEDERRALKRGGTRTRRGTSDQTHRSDVTNLPDLPRDVDAHTVQALIDGNTMTGATRDERAWAAVGLYRAGLMRVEIARRLGVQDKTVSLWLQRADAGEALNRRPAATRGDQQCYAPEPVRLGR